MIYPIVAYGGSILRKKAMAIAQRATLQSLVQDMFMTMKLASGVGLAAPQVGKCIRLFVIDLTPYLVEKETRKSEGKKIFINPVLTIDETVPPSTREEGCLSVPTVFVEVPRREKITIRYFDIQWQLHEEVWTGWPARIIQHECDHLEGKLHIDYASSLRRRLLKNKLKAIRQGDVNVSYQMHFSA
mmetsp:Transcript_4358/g.9848  ORF Transcript_4358/g.9848 Transcript_4358/m.9848 type:complete len:186 (-) Transcript_4358:2812-3369(-)